MGVGIQEAQAEGRYRECVHGDLVRAHRDPACMRGRDPVHVCMQGSSLCVYAWGSGVGVGIQWAREEGQCHV